MLKKKLFISFCFYTSIFSNPHSPSANHVNFAPNNIAQKNSNHSSPMTTSNASPTQQKTITITSIIRSDLLSFYNSLPSSEKEIITTEYEEGKKSGKSDSEIATQINGLLAQKKYEHGAEKSLSA